MRLTSGGNLGLGTTSPTSISGFTSLTLNNTTNGGIVDFQSSGTGVGRIINDATTFNVLALGSTAPLILGAGGSEKMRITTGGNVGIGNTVSAWDSIFKPLQIGSYGGYIAGRTDDNSMWIGTNHYYNGSQWIYSTTGAVSQMFFASDEVVFRNNTSGTAGTATGFNERMRIMSGGNIRVYVTPAVDSNIEWYNTSSGTIAGRVWSDGNPRVNVQCNSAGGVYLASAGVAWLALSDERLKTDLVPIDDSLNKVISLRALIGRYKTDEVGTKRPFLIAQDVQKVLPEIVDVNQKNGDLGLSYTEIIPLLVGAIKELEARLKTLENK
jgi:hypothetical protein